MIPYPEYLHLSDEQSYRDYFETELCSKPWPTLSIGIPVLIFKDRFSDAFYESADRARRDKSVFAWERAKRMDWIKVAISDTAAVLTYSWNRDTRTIDRSRLNVIIQDQSYVVVLRTPNDWQTVKFVTAFSPNQTVLQKMLAAPKWDRHSKNFGR